MTRLPKLKFALRIWFQYGYRIGSRPPKYFTTKVIRADPHTFHMVDLVVLMEDVLDHLSARVIPFNLRHDDAMFAKDLRRMERAAVEEYRKVLDEKKPGVVPVGPIKVNRILAQRDDEVPATVAQRGLLRIDWNHYPRWLKTLLVEHELGIEQSSRRLQFLGLNWKYYQPGSPYSIFKRKFPEKERYEKQSGA